MNVPQNFVAAGGAVRLVRQSHQPWTVNAPAPRPTVRTSAYTRRYEVMWLDPNGEVQDFIRVAPALPLFEEAFSAFAHGALVQTVNGPVAVEDLVPGMMIETVNAGPMPLRWVGAITLIPGAPARNGTIDHTYRLTADAFGLARPSLDVNLGPAARILSRNPAVVGSFGSEAALTPVAGLADGVNVIEVTPVSPVRVYHLAFDEHAILNVNGIEVESFHPGPDAHYSLSNEMREMFLALFPHIETMSDFGRMLWPRLEAVEDLHELA